MPRAGLEALADTRFRSGNRPPVGGDPDLLPRTVKARADLHRTLVRGARRDRDGEPAAWPPAARGDWRRDTCSPANVLRGVRWRPAERDTPAEPLGRAVTEAEIPTTGAVDALAGATPRDPGVWWRELEILLVAYSGMRWGEHVALTATGATPPAGASPSTARSSRPARRSRRPCPKAGAGG